MYIMGNKEKPINWDLVELYVKAGSKQANICKYLQIDSDTLRKRVRKKFGKDWSVYSDALRCEGEMHIEAQQYQKAMKGYWPALQWLGKIRCGQREPENTQLSAPNQNDIDLRHENMMLKHRLAELEKNAN